MTTGVVVRGLLVVVAGAALVLLSAFSDSIVRPDYVWHHAETIRSPSGDIEGVSMYDTQPIRSTFEVIVLIALPLLGLAVAAVYLASRVSTAKVVVGGTASACVALISFGVIYSVEWRKPGEAYFPAVMNALVWVALGFVVGAVASWVFVRTWPNKSLERTREG
jgi:hypothetical protein